MDLDTHVNAPIDTGHRTFLAQTHAIIDPTQVAAACFADLSCEPLEPVELSGYLRQPPLLVALDAMSRDRRLEVLDRAELHLRERGRPLFCTLLACNEAAHLRGHLRHLMGLWRPGKGRVWFRVHDPRVFRHLRWLLTPAQMAEVMGPVHAWTWHEPLGGTWRTHHRPDAHAPFGLLLQPDQWLGLEQLGVINACLRDLVVDPATAGSGADQLKLFKALNAKAVMPGAAIQQHLQRTLSVVDLHDAMRSTVSGLHRSSHGYGVAGLIMMSASLGHLNQQIMKAPVEEQGLLQANFAAGAAALIGDSAILLGEVGAKLPWSSKTLAEPMGRWMFRAGTRAAVVQAGGKILSGVAGMILGALTITEGISDFSLDKVYGGLMISSGLATAFAALMMLFGWAVPVAIALMLIAATVTIVVAWFKPDEIERWLDKALHFGSNNKGAFPHLSLQMAELEKLRRQ